MVGTINVGDTVLVEVVVTEIIMNKDGTFYMVKGVTMSSVYEAKVLRADIKEVIGVRS